MWAKHTSALGTEESTGVGRWWGGGGIWRTSWKVQHNPTASEWQTEPDWDPYPSSLPCSVLVTPGELSAWDSVGSPCPFVI